MSGQTEYITKGSSSFSVIVNLLQDNSGTNPGDPLTGLVYNSTNLVCYYKSGGTGTVTQLTLATQTSSGAFSLGGFAQLSSSNMPGAYRLDLSTTLFSSGDDFGQVMLSGYADLAAHAVHVKFLNLDIYQSFSDALSTYGVSTISSTDVDDSLATYGPSTHTSTDIQDLLPANFSTVSISTAGAVSNILLSSAATSPQLVDDIWDEALTGAAHNVVNSAGRRLRSLQDNGLYALAAVWVDEVNGTSTGTTSYEDATVTNRANDFDNAQTVAAAIFLNRIYPANGNSITLTATINNFQIGIPGGNWTLALGGQNIGGCDINDATVSGTGTGTRPHFHNCEIGAVTCSPCNFYGCGFTGTFTVGSAGDYEVIDCQSLVAGASAPVWDMGAAVGATTISFRRWSGGLTLNNVATGDVVSIDVVSGGTITINGTGGTVVVRGMCNVVDGSSGSVTITETSVVNMTKINTECDTAISDAALATAASLATAQTDLDTITGADGVVIASGAQTFNMTGNITGNLSGSVGSVTGNVGGNVVGSVGSNLELGPAEVNAEIVDALATDTYAEPGQGAPGATVSLAAKINYLYKFLRNKVTTTSDTISVYNDDATTVDHKATHSDDNTTYTKGEFTTGP